MTHLQTAIDVKKVFNVFIHRSYFDVNLTFFIFKTSEKVAYTYYTQQTTMTKLINSIGILIQYCGIRIISQVPKCLAI